MASEVTPEGRVVAPLNITAPTPDIDLKGFYWDTVDEKINGPPAAPIGHGSHQQSLQAQVVDAPDVSRRVGEVPPPSGPAAPPPGTASLPKQLATQVGLKDAPRAGPLFPLEQFKGAYAGNGFNLIFRPRANGPDSKCLDGLPIQPGDNSGPDDNILVLNLTTEQVSFGGTLGDIPNRGLRKEPDIRLSGLPYLQTVQDHTFPATGRCDHPKKIDIHFEPGVWLNVPPASFHNGKASVVRMASIPHGTTINAQGFAPKRDPKTVTGGVTGGPDIGVIDTTPFDIGKPEDPKARKNGIFISMNETTQESFRIPQDLETFGSYGSGTITTEIIKNPNLVLLNAITDLDITETITFEVSTGHPESTLNGGGTTNISFLQGVQNPITSTVMNSPTAHAASMTAKYWIERVMYKVVVPEKLPPNTQLLLRPTMPADSTAPTPVFSITTGPGGNPTRKEITVPGIQIQTSQTVLLNFMTLSWPHVSVSTLVPVDPQPFQMT
ncbi:MAG: hypothetical protein M1822_000521 [Bathelium mastoideum]|nr:MAG: hypothetical protein M1822_000521 [Bathelium mastoideum]